MHIYSTASARLFVAGPSHGTDVASDNSIAGAANASFSTADLEARGVVRVLCVGEPAPALELPVDIAPFNASVANRYADVDAAIVEDGAGGADPPAAFNQLLAQQLADAARLMDAALASASSCVAAGNTVASAEALSPAVSDDLPGESSDEEGGSSEGTRLRVRISRSGEEKWGITWHANIFKTTQRLVVKDIADDSVMGRWNASRPERFQVGYGDRLIRINGVRADDYLPAKAAEKMRAELKQPVVRALFWRPGGADEADEVAEKPAAVAPPSAVLVCAGSDELFHRVAPAAKREAVGAAVAAAVVVAHTLLHGISPASQLVQGEGEREACSLDAALNALGDAGLLLQELGDAGNHINAALRALEGHRKTQDEPVKAADVGSTENLEVHLTSAEEGAPPAELESIPQWTFSCRKCGTALFHDLSVLPHYTDGAHKASRAWAAQPNGALESSGCTSVFVEPMGWMGDLSEPTGRLKCANPRCGQKLGGYSWHGLPCSCGQWQSPAFQIHNARIECMPAGRRTRGPAPVPAFQS